jgi:hypothetical protein
VEKPSIGKRRSSTKKKQTLVVLFLYDFVKT